MRGRTSVGQILAACAALVLAACAGPPIPAVPARPGIPATAGSGGINRIEHQDKPYVILVSLDGFKPEYLERFDLPHIRSMAVNGARARALIPVFPSLTFPNHYSLATGLYPEHHGIVSNSFYDPATGERYSLSNRAAVENATWYRGEPIWVTAEKQGMVAACFFWPGSEAAIGGVRPTFWKPYDEGVPNDERIQTVIQWLRLPAKQRPHIVTLYFSELDSASHDGPLDSPAIERAARSLDRSLGALSSALPTLPVGDDVYMLLTSDHGMAELRPSQELALDSLLTTSRVKIAYGGPVANLHVADGGRDAVQVRDELNARLKNGRAYLREELPERLHYRADPRAGDVIVVMEESWTLTTGLRRLVRPFRGTRGMHGWDPSLPSMHALFVAAGPGIRAGTIVEEVEMVDLYPFITELLGLRAAPNIDGRRGRIRRQIMRQNAPLPRH